MIVAPISVTTGYGAAKRMIIFQDRQNQHTIVTVLSRIEAGAAFHQSPAVVLATLAVCRLEIDFFQGILTDVGNEHISG